MARPIIFRTYKGRLLSVSAIAKECGLHRDTILRHARHADDVTELVECSLRRHEQARETQRAKLHGLKACTFRMRMTRGWTLDEAMLIPVGMR